MDTDQKERLHRQLDVLEAKINGIRRNVRVMMQIHEQLHPEELERARQQVRSEREDLPEE